MTTKRPVAVTVLGWLFVAAGALMILSAGMAIPISLSMREFRQVGPPAPPMGFLFEYFHLFAFFQVAFAAFILVAAYHFLKLRAWARTALEVVCWLGLAFIVGFGAFWVTNWLRLASPSAFPAFDILGAAMGCVVTAIQAGVVIVIIWVLRGPTVRGAVE